MLIFQRALQKTQHDILLELAQHEYRPEEIKITLIQSGNGNLSNKISILLPITCGRESNYEMELQAHSEPLPYSQAKSQELERGYQVNKRAIKRQKRFMARIRTSP